MSLRLTYLQTAYLAAETMQALEALASDTTDYGYALSCILAMSILDAAVQEKDLTAVNSALAWAVHVMDGGQ